MVAIDAENKAMRRAIEKLVTLTEACGAQFARDVVIRSSNGSLSIASKGGEDGKIFMKMPRQSLPRIDQYQFSLGGGDIVLAEAAEAAPPMHFQIVDAMMELYNLCGKAAQHERSSSWLFLADQPELVPLVSRARGDMMVRALTDRLKSGDIVNLALDTFLMTRVIRIDGVLHLMPVAELVNHSALAPPFYFPPRKKGGGVAVRRQRFPKRSGDECFACYAKLDSLDSWLIYNFVEEHADFMHSVPLVVTLPGAGVIRVHGDIAHDRSPVIPPGLEDLKEWLPAVTEKSADGIEIDMLLIPSASSPVLRRVLRWVVDQMAPGHARADALAEDAEKQVLEKNWAFYEDLRRRLQGVELKNPAKKPVLDGLNSLCALQLGRLIEYGK